jgi:hypothetical protein
MNLINGLCPDELETLSDNGCGIPPSYRDKIFEPYFTTRGKIKAHGIHFGRYLNGRKRGWDNSQKIFSVQDSAFFGVTQQNILIFFGFNVVQLTR